MLDLIHRNLKFDEALFMPNISSILKQTTGNLRNRNEKFLFFFSNLFAYTQTDNTYTFAQPNRSQQNSKYWSNLSVENKSKAFNCISDAFDYIQQNYECEQLDVLVTGSLHLVGEVLRTIRD